MRRFQGRLGIADPTIDWSVKNQVRMHTRNCDAPYGSGAGALWFWPETATAVAVRLYDERALEIAAPFGLDDLFGLILRPTPRIPGSKLDLFVARVVMKGWPDLIVAA